jgi:hypothetical protein
MLAMDALQQTSMAKPSLSDEEFRRETSDRLRRLETRLTKFMEWMGFDTEVRRPAFDARLGRLDIPTDAVSLRDCIAVIPPASPSVAVYHKGTHIASISLKQ